MVHAHRGDDRGTAAEYAMLAAAVAAVVVAIVFALGQHVNRVYDSSCDSAAQARQVDGC